jgi:hypothetical protein
MGIPLTARADKFARREYLLYVLKGALRAPPAAPLPAARLPLPG